MADEVNDFLMSSGVASAKFESIGTMVDGMIESMEVRNQTDIKTGEVQTWNDGNVKKQLVVTLQTDQFDDDDDDGLRRVFVKGQMSKALRDAVRKTGERGIADGGRLAVKYVGDGEQAQRGFSPPKQYQVSYQAPAPQPVSIGEDGEFNYEGEAPPPADNSMPF